MALLAGVVRKALRTVKDPGPADVAAAELAIHYAKAIDEAELVAASLAKVLREVQELDIDVYDRLLPLAVRIERTAVLASLGPKLLAALESLLMTPRSRAAVRRGVKDAAKRANPLDQLMDRRAARERNPSPVDPASP